MNNTFFFQVSPNIGESIISNELHNENIEMNTTESVVLIKKYELYPWRWFILLVFCLLTLSNGMVCEYSFVSYIKEIK